MSKPNGLPKTGGRKRGVPNKVTADVRKVIALFAEANAPTLQKWLDRIAETDPARAADLYLRALEYYVPKLARREVSGPDGEPIEKNQSLTVRFVSAPGK